ncbi:MAG TPA: PAS domain-containing sensor histidine kinase [Gemmatimonadaceae bacterium]|nr:PAS domain-containing sensor histidine kinase [Gemmatimonadaceae bacterium]
MADLSPADGAVATHELSLAYEELSVVEEELRVQNDELGRAQSALHDERRRYHELFHQAPVAYLVTDEYGSIREANHSATQLLRYREEALIGKPLAVFTRDKSRRRMRAAVSRLNAGEDVVSFRVDMTTRAEATITIDATVAASRNHRGRLVELRWLLVHASGRRKAARAARKRSTRLETLVGERTAELEHAQTLKDQLLATVSHELRTPLAAIGGYTDLLSMGLRGDLTDDQLGDIRRIHRAYEHLARIVDDLLNFNKLVTHKLSFDIGDVVLADVVRGAWELTALQAQERGMNLELGALPTAVVRADDERLRQIIVNLIGNAVKFTPPGGVVRVETIVSGDSAMVSVEDNGPGIPASSCETIFEPFVRLGDANGVPGTGLGLAISRDMAREMGGDLTVVSDVGIGSCFTLRVPVSTRLAMHRQPVEG